MLVHAEMFHRLFEISIFLFAFITFIYFLRSVGFAAFFLHTVAEEFQTNIFKRMGAAVKSFFAGMLRKNKKMKVPGSWAQIQERAEAQQTSDPAGFQGALHAITQLSSMFHKRFLQPVIDAQASSPIAPAYIAFIHGIVGQWMVPHNEKLNISDPRIPRAKKIFYYNIFSHRELKATPVASLPISVRPPVSDLIHFNNSECNKSNALAVAFF